MRPRLVWLALLALGLLPLRAFALEEGEPVADSEVLLRINIGDKDDGHQGERWSKQSKTGTRTYRSIPVSNPLCRLTVPAWWDEGDAPAEDAILAVTFQDQGENVMNVATYNKVGRIWGNDLQGWIGGAGDGAWKTEYVLLRNSAMRLLDKDHDDAKGKRVTQILFQVNGGSYRMQEVLICNATPALREHLVKTQSARRAKAIASIRDSDAFRHVPLKGEFKAIQPADETETKAKFTPFQRSYNVKILPERAPFSEERGTKVITLTAAQGEIEPAQFGVHAFDTISVTASITALTGPEGKTLNPETDLELFWIESTSLRKGGSWSKTWQLQPAWLRPVTGAVAVEKETTQGFWLRVTVPENTPAGEYKGMLTLNSKGGAFEIPVNLTVLPFTLNEPETRLGAYCGTGMLDTDELADMRAHGLNSLSLFAANGFVPEIVKKKCVLANADEWHRFLGEAKQQGFREMINFGGGDTWWDKPHQMPLRTKTDFLDKQFRKYYVQFWKDISKHANQGNWPEIICCPFDEPVKEQKKINAFIQLKELANKADRKMRIFCVFMNRPHNIKDLGRHGDIWSCNGNFEEFAKGIKKHRQSVLYTYTGNHPDVAPGEVRMNMGFAPWHFGAAGTYFWAYQWHALDPFNDLDGGNRDWSPVSRDVDGQLYASPCWEGCREGADDLRYIATCKALAEKAGRKDILKELEAIREEFRPGDQSDESVKTEGFDAFSLKLKNADELDRIRKQLINRILEMKR